jgi:hypothetical protein
VLFDDLLERFDTATRHLEGMARNIVYAWEPLHPDFRRAHNNYVRSLAAAYASKMHELCETTLQAAQAGNYLVYGLCGRALLETVATLRYYNLQHYSPLFQGGGLDANGAARLIELDDQHLRGSRFDWDSFLSADFAKLREDVRTSLSKKSGASPQSSDLPTQVNVLTCMQKWAQDDPDVMVAYGLFCDLVHPNIGSNMLVASIDSDNHLLYFAKHRGLPVGRVLYERTFPLLVAISQKEFAKQFAALLYTVWQDDEL